MTSVFPSDSAHLPISDSNDDLMNLHAVRVQVLESTFAFEGERNGLIRVDLEHNDS